MHINIHSNFQQPKIGNNPHIPQKLNRKVICDTNYSDIKAKQWLPEDDELSILGRGVPKRHKETFENNGYVFVILILDSGDSFISVYHSKYNHLMC